MRPEPEKDYLISPFGRHFHLPGCEAAFPAHEHDRYDQVKGSEISSRYDPCPACVGGLSKHRRSGKVK